MGEIIRKPAPNPLPATVEDLEARRRVFHQPTLNDRVDAYHVKLWENPTYRRYLDAVYDEDAAEGARVYDDGEAARMIREEAKQVQDTYVAEKKLATIVKALKVCLNRYGIGRHQRAREVAGELMDASNNGAE